MNVLTDGDAHVRRCTNHLLEVIDDEGSMIRIGVERVRVIA